MDRKKTVTHAPPPINPGVKFTSSAHARNRNRKVKKGMRFATGGGIQSQQRLEPREDAPQARSEHHRGVLFSAIGGREDMDGNQMKRQSQAELNVNCGPDLGLPELGSGMCPRKQRRSASWLKGRKSQKKFRIRLKKEAQNFRSEYLEYNADFPNRVAVRLEYLLGTTKVRLNDPRYMDQLHAALAQEEELSKRKVEIERERVEKSRVKKLVVEGEMEPPAELSYLYNHPVFRVNEMFRRLNLHEDSLFAVPKTDGKIRPCEPFEYNSGAFFKHLHRTGRRDWVPREVRMERRKEVRERRERVRKRHEERRLSANRENKDMELLYRKQSGFGLKDALQDNSNNGSGTLFDETPPQVMEEFEDIEIGEEEETDRARLKRVTTAGAHKMVVDQILQETLEQRSREIERKRRYRSKEELEDKKLREIELRRRNRKSEPSSLFIDEEPLTPVLSDDDSLQTLRKSYNVRSRDRIESYRQQRNTLISKYIDDIQDPNELFKNAKEVKMLYQREQLVCEEFLKKLNRFRE